MNHKSLKFIACGMYAFTDELRAAWQSLFDAFLLNYSPAQVIEPTIRFESDFSLLRNPHLLIGHTCGYPLMQYLRDGLAPVCVPVFDLPGCEGKLYSSQIIVPANSNIQTLSDCKGKVAAINGRDSNSGMNVFRHAVAGLSKGMPFFAEVIESGSHYQSLVAVANNQAQVASIDCVSFALIKDQWPELVEQVRVIGFTEPTCGLPFVMPKTAIAQVNSNLILSALKKAADSLKRSEKDRLHLSGFEAVKLTDYNSIMSLEQQAIKNGYTTFA